MKIPLTEPQRGALLVVRYAARPGHISGPRNPSLCALERRGLVASRPDPTAPHLSIWTPTADGIAWTEQDRIDR